MTRVDENREAQRYEEQKRAEDKDKAQRENTRQEFGRLMSQKQAQSSDATRQQQQAAMAHSKQSTRGNEALLARHGIQSKSFQQHLEKRGEKFVTENRGQIKERDTESKETKRAGESEKQVRDKAEVDKQEGRLAAISRDDRKGSGGGGGGGGTGADAGTHQDAMGGGQSLVADGVAQAGPAEAAHGASGPQLPPELIQKLVERVFVGVNQEGLSEFTIELKESVLAGSRLSISAKDGKIFARFHTEDVNVKRLLKASEGELARAFGRKGLSLERLEVEGP